MLNLSSRPCLIGPSINTRTEKHGDDDVPALDIPITSVMLTAEEAGELLGQSGQAIRSRLFNARKEPAEPSFPDFKPFALKHKLEDVEVELRVGIDEHVLAFSDVRLARITLEPQVGGLIAFSCQVQQTVDLDGDDLERLFQAMNHEARISFSGGKVEQSKPKKQPELALDHEGDAEQPSTH